MAEPHEARKHRRLVAGEAECDEAIDVGARKRAGMKGRSSWSYDT